MNEAYTLQIRGGAKAEGRDLLYRPKEQGPFPVDAVQTDTYSYL